jgi:methylmalonyl-CoA mutase
VWNTPDGITVKPYYRAEHLENLAFMGALPGEKPYVRGKRVKDNDWAIHQDIEEENTEKANALAIKAIAKGAQSVGFNTRGVQGMEALADLLQGIDLKRVSIGINHAISYPPLLELLTELTGDISLKGYLNFDPLGYYVLYGKLYQNLEANMDEAESLLQMGGAKHPDFKVITINGQHYHNAGAGIVQELAFALSQANEYLARLTDRGLGVDAIAPKCGSAWQLAPTTFWKLPNSGPSKCCGRQLWNNTILRKKKAAKCFYMLGARVGTKAYTTLTQTCFEPPRKPCRQPLVG